MVKKPFSARHVDSTSRKRMSNHINFTCEMQIWSCEECGSNMFRKDRDAHLTFCRGCACLDCGRGFTDRHARQNHALNECPLRPWACDKCGLNMHARNMRQHVAHECPEKIVCCDYCAVEYKLKDEHKHKLEECAVTFTNANSGAKFSSHDKLMEHELSQCPRRTVKCRRCEVMGASSLDRHERSSCRLIKCTCERWIMKRDQETHLQTQCPMRREACRLGCGEHMLECEREEHEANRCRLRAIVCDKCGDVVTAEMMESHCESQCQLRRVPCPHCGETVPSRHLSDHFLHECSESFWRCACKRIARIDDGRLDTLKNAKLSSAVGKAY